MAVSVESTTTTDLQLEQTKPTAHDISTMLKGRTNTASPSSLASPHLRTVQSLPIYQLTGPLKYDTSSACIIHTSTVLPPCRGEGGGECTAACCGVQEQTGGACGRRQAHVSRSAVRTWTRQSRRSPAPPGRTAERCRRSAACFALAREPSPERHPQAH